jgi:hypothetical protein
MDTNTRLITETKISGHCQISPHGLSFTPTNRYPIPANNTFLSLEGFLDDVDTDSTGRTNMFYISVDNMNLLTGANNKSDSAGHTQQHGGRTHSTSATLRSTRLRFRFGDENTNDNDDEQTPGARAVHSSLSIRGRYFDVCEKRFKGPDQKKKERIGIIYENDVRLTSEVCR